MPVSLIDFSKTTRHGRECETCKFALRAEIDEARREGNLGAMVIRRWLIEEKKYKDEDIPTKASLDNHFLARHHEQKPAKVR